MQNNIEESRILFKDMVISNIENIKEYMIWENYTLNSTFIPVTELVKEHALDILIKSYGKFKVDADIFDEFCADVFIYFPILLQQLAITRLIDAYGVVTDDIDTVETIRTESLNMNTEQNSELKAGTMIKDSNNQNMVHKTTGTISVDNNMFNTDTATTNIKNTSGVESTGNRSVNLSHNMPEQSINAGTGNFPTDSQGSPKLPTSYVQVANESFNSMNPINTNEFSDQTMLNTNTANNDSTTTNDVTVSDNGSETRTTENSGSDNTESKSATESKNTLNEKVISNTTNKQYAYEIKAFLETSDGLIAFSKWEDRFTWIIGII